jgi:peptidoglycan/LPS O-acetylase OafA/YrhL
VAALARAPRGIHARLDDRLGNLAYPIFVLHVAVGTAASTLGGPLARIRGAPLLVASIALTNLGAYLLWRFVEAPVQRIRLRVRRSP